MFILDSNRFGRDPDGMSGQLNALIEKHGGEILVSRLWEERRLAYPIKNQKKGTYWLIYLRMDSLKLKTVREQCEINESLLRYMFLKIEPRIVDALVAHAQSAPIPQVSHVEEAVAVTVGAADDDLDGIDEFEDETEE
jgi:small subunit ribosomal protein S6